MAWSQSGTYAQQAICLESQVHRLPPHINFEQGASLNISYSAVFRAINPVVGGTMGLKEAARAHKEIMSEGAFGKIVLIP